MVGSPLQDPSGDRLPPFALRPRRELGTRLPALLTSFVGREHEMRELSSLLRRTDTRLLSLIGPGGVGKTRLAIELARQLEGEFPDGAHFVDLAAIRDPSLVLPAVAHALDLRRREERSVHDALVEELRGRHLLLVLDNFEHLLDVAPAWLVDLLGVCPLIKALVTSRAAMHIGGEQRYEVPPLPVADTDTIANESAAVALFVQRARAVRLDFAWDETDRETIRNICRRLDGLPLAIELAAARVNVLTLEEIEARLTDRFALLQGGQREAAPRLRSMADAIGWSFDLLSPDEQAVLRCLSVFVGGFTLDAAAVVCGDDAIDILSSITTLIDHSLVRRVAGGHGDSRYTMLETIREFAAIQLAASGSEDAVRDRHAAWSQALAVANDWAWFRPLDAGTVAQRRLEEEHANVRAALGWLKQTGDSAGLLQLAGDLVGLWAVCGYLAEGQEWLEHALAADLEVDAVARGYALGALAWICALSGQSRRALEVAEQGIDLLRDRGPSPALAHCLAQAGQASRQLGDFDAAVDHQREAMAVLQRLDTTALPAGVLQNWRISLEAGLGHSALVQGDVDRAATHYARARDLQLADGRAPGASHIYGNHVVTGLGDVARAEGNLAKALEFYRTGLDQAWRAGDVRAVAHTIGGIAGSLAALGRHDEAATLFGASEAIHDTYGYRFVLETLDRQRALGLPEPWAHAGDPCGVWEPLRRAVLARGSWTAPSVRSPVEVAARWDDGRRLSLEAAVAAALTIEATATAAPETVMTLSKRELDVLRLLVEGQSDREIARDLGISYRSVTSYVRNILTKLEVQSRTAAATHALRHGLV